MRLVGWKLPDIVVEACTRLGLRLVVAGEGRVFDRLRKMAGPTVDFIGRVDGERKAQLLSRCAALILPAIEDFGITPLEAMASGRPVIAIGKGGVLDTVVPGVTGAFFHEQTTESLVEALRAFDPDAYDCAEIRRHVTPFSRESFRQRITSAVRSSLSGSAESAEDRIAPSLQGSQGELEEIQHAYVDAEL